MSLSIGYTSRPVMLAKIVELRHGPMPRSGEISECVCSSAFCTWIVASSLMEKSGATA